MEYNYDFSTGRKIPYAKKLKKPVSIRLDDDTVGYFTNLAAETAIPYETLINIFLRDCATTKKTLQIAWKPRAA